jgi:hypothetical protein
MVKTQLVMKLLSQNGVSTHCFPTILSALNQLFPEIACIEWARSRIHTKKRLRQDTLLISGALGLTELSGNSVCRSNLIPRPDFVLVALHGEPTIVVIHSRGHHLALTMLQTQIDVT